MLRPLLVYDRNTLLGFEATDDRGLLISCTSEAGIPRKFLIAITATCFTAVLPNALSLRCLKSGG